MSIHSPGKTLAGGLDISLTEGIILTEVGRFIRIFDQLES